MGLIRPISKAHIGLAMVFMMSGMMATNAQIMMGQSAPPPSGIKQRWFDVVDFIKYCAIYMHRYSPRFHKPNERCCESARKVNISLFCKVFLIKETEKIFNPAKVAVVAKHCHNPLPRYSKCGSYIVRRAIEKSISASGNKLHEINTTISDINVDSNYIFH